MDALSKPLHTAPEHVTAKDYAIQALAQAMTERAEPLRRVPPTEDMVTRAGEIVRATLDIAGRPFAVLLADDLGDAQRLRAACGRDTDGDLGEALLVIKRLTGA